MERFSYFDLIFYTQEQADAIGLVVRRILIDEIPVSSLVSNKADFLKKLKKAVSDDREEHFLSFKPMSNGRVSLHLRPDGGFIKLGIFDVDPDLVTAIHLKEKDAFEHFAFEEVGNRFLYAVEKVALNEHKYDAQLANGHIRQQFDLSNFPEVEVLGNVRLDPDAYHFLNNANEGLKRTRESAEKKLRDEYILTSQQFEGCVDFIVSVEELYRDHLDKGEEQVAYFEPVYYEDDEVSGLILRKTEHFLAEREVSPRTASSLFSIRTDHEIALDYDDALKSGTLSKMKTRFETMFIAISMVLVQEFSKNCVLVDGPVKVTSTSV